MNKECDPKRPDCVVLVAHGIGNQQRWEILEEFQGGLLSFFNSRLRGQAKISTEPAPKLGHLDKGYDFTLQPDTPEGLCNETPHRVRLREFHWADLDGGLPPDLLSSLNLPLWLFKTGVKALPKFRRLAPPGCPWFRALLLYIRAGGLFLALLLASLLALLVQLVNAPLRGRYGFWAKLAGLVIEYLGDVMQLEDKKVRQSINERLHRTITEVIGLDQPRFLVLVSHSLGNIFMLDQLEGQLIERPLPMGWISVGSPLWVMPLIENKYRPGGPLNLKLDLGWHNMFDPMDPVAGPIFSKKLSNPLHQWKRCHFNPVSAHLKYLTTEHQLARLWEVVAEGLARYKNHPAPSLHVPKNRRILAAGPLLRHGGPDQLNVWTAHYQPGIHRARLLRDGQPVAELVEEVRQEDQLTHMWRFEGLTPATEYQFEVGWQDPERAGCFWRLTRDNRKRESLRARPAGFALKTPPNPEQGPWRFLFASCHYPRHVHWDGEAGQGFIASLLNRLDREGRPLNASFMIGDQIYADDWWHDQLLLPWTDPEARRRARMGLYSEVYDVFWRRGPWGDLLRRAPTSMMWDDHDIRDGWGCNANDFYQDQATGQWLRKPASQEKFRCAWEAFRLYQAAGNPPAASPDDFQFELNLGPVSIFVFDPRTYRNYRQPCLFHPFGPQQMDRYLEWLNRASQTAQVLMVVTSSPTAFIKSWRLNLVSKHLPPLMRWVEDFLHWDAFDDDWRDQMPNELNLKARNFIVENLARVVAAKKPGEVKALLIAGDVHVGAYNRITIGPGRHIDLWTASPISNKPNKTMRKAAAWATDKRPAGKLDGKPLLAREFWSKAARNAVLINVHPDPAGGPPKVRGEIHWESGHELACLSREL